MLKVLYFMIDSLLLSGVFLLTVSFFDRFFYVLIFAVGHFLLIVSFLLTGLFMLPFSFLLSALFQSRPQKDVLQKPVFVTGAGYHFLPLPTKSAPSVTPFCPLGYPIAPFAAFTLILHPVLTREILARAHS